MKMMFTDHFWVRVSRGKPDLVYNRMQHVANTTGGPTVDMANVIAERITTAIQAVRPTDEAAENWVGQVDVQITVGV